MKMTPDFFKMVHSGEQFTVKQWAAALECPQYQFNSALMFSAVTGVALSRIKEVPHEFSQAPRRPDPGDDGAIRRS